MRIYYNGIALDGEDYGFQCTDVDRPILAAPALTVVKQGDADGADVAFESFEPYSMTIRGAIKGATRNEIITRRDNFAILLTPSNGEGTLVVDEEESSSTPREYVCIVSSEIKRERYGAAGLEISFSVLVSSGKGQAVADTEQAITGVSAASHLFTIPASGVVGGTYTSFPIFVFTNNGPATTTIVVLANGTVGVTSSTTWTGAIGSGGGMLRIDSEREIIEQSSDGGTTWTNVMSGKTAGNPFPKLRAGVSNSFTFGSATASGRDIDIDIAYREIYH